jgi:phosphoribosylformylglycinamidine synthase II
LKENYWREVGLSDEEYAQIREILQREPNQLELEMFGAMWSEHCSYKNSRNILKMLPTTGQQVLQGPGENAGVVDIGDDQAIVFKIESRNHLSAIEPFQGAATAVGGILRDVFTMGARPIAVLNALYFGSLKSKVTRARVANVVAGLATYGNNVQVPTVAGLVFFHPSYEKNCLVNVMGVGLVKQQELVKAQAIGEGNPVMLVGAFTGKDFVRGASFVSEAFGEALAGKREELAVADPTMGKILMEACLELIKTGNVIGMQDLGAGGLTGSCCDMAARGGTGIEIEVTKVPYREKEMDTDQIMLAETPERMLIVLPKGKEREAQKLFLKWGIEAAVIGRVTSDGLITVKEKGKIAARLPVSALVEDVPIQERQAREPEGLAQAQAYDLAALPEMEDYGKVLLTLLGEPTIAGKEWIYGHFDHLLDIDTMIPPGDDAAVLRVIGYNKGVALTVDGNSRYVYLDPYRGGQIAVAEAARNIVCCGGTPLAVTDCLNFGNPENPEIYWRLKEAVAGIGDACREFNTPVTGGNVSFNNETEGEAIYPTPVIGMLGIVQDLAHVTTMAFKQEDDLIILLGKNKDELGASSYLSLIHGLEAGRPPELNLELEKQVQQAAATLIQEKLAVSAHDCAEGGLAIALAECCIAGKIGAEIALVENLRPSSLLFGESQSRIIISIRKEKLDLVLQKLNNWQVPFKVLGSVGGEQLLITGSGWKINLGLREMEEKYRGAIECIINNS